MAHWLRCTLSTGQFPDEYVVQGETTDGKGFSMFADARYVDADTGLPEQRGVKTQGWIRLDWCDERDGVMLVKLPQEALERGYFIRVPASNVSSRKESQRLESA